MSATQLLCFFSTVCVLTHKAAPGADDTRQSGQIAAHFHAIPKSRGAVEQSGPAFTLVAAHFQQQNPARREALPAKLFQGGQVMQAVLRGKQGGLRLIPGHFTA